MTKPATEPKRIREWLLSLFALTTNMTRIEIEAKAGAFIPILQREFPPPAFTADSLAYCARQGLTKLTYDEICAHLAKWWRDNRPYVPALPPPPMPWQQSTPQPRTPPTPEEHEAVRKAAAEAIAALRSAAQTQDDYRVQPAARYLSPGILDQINPLPNGRRRTA